MPKTSLTFQFIFLVLLLHIALGVLLWMVLEEHKIWFLLAEFIIIISLLLFFNFYQKLLKPLQFIGDGVNALRDRDFHVKYLPVGSKELDPLIATFNEMIDAMRAERIQTREQHYFLEKLIKASPVGILVLDYDGEIAQYNPRVAKIFDEAFLKTINSSSNNENNKEQYEFYQALQKMAIGETEIIDFNNSKYRCEATHFLDKGFKRKFILIQDLSVELLQTEKKAYGQVIRMMAHEVNNSIGAINSILDSVRTDAEEEQQLSAIELAAYLKLAIERNDGLNQFMKNFASVIRLPAPLKGATDICTLLRSNANVLQSSQQDQQIKFSFHFAEEPMVIDCDRRQIEQAFINIIKNAMESIGEEPNLAISGQIEIYVNPEKIVIADNGKGISPDQQAEIFTPFWSSKANGQGIGLMLVREIFNNHNWQYSLRTFSDGWTRFEIKLK